MINPVTLTLTVAAAAAAGFGAGVLARRNLDRLGYRQGDETHQPAPAPRRWVPWITAAALATLTLAAMVSPQPLLMLPMTPLALTGAWLAAVDLDVHRLPNRITGPVAVATALVVGTVATLTGSPFVAILSLLGGILAGLVFLASHFLTRGGIGMGDVKLAAVAGLALGAHGLNHVTLALITGSLPAIIWAKATQRTEPVAYGPWLLLGAWAVPLSASILPIVVLVG